METQRTSALAPAGAQIARMRRLRRRAQRAERAFALRIKFAAIAAVAVYAAAVTVSTHGVPPAALAPTAAARAAAPHTHTADARDALHGAFAPSAAASATNSARTAAAGADLHVRSEDAYDALHDALAPMAAARATIDVPMTATSAMARACELYYRPHVMKHCVHPAFMYYVALRTIHACTCTPLHAPCDECTSRVPGADDSRRAHTHRHGSRVRCGRRTMQHATHARKGTTHDEARAMTLGAYAKRPGLRHRPLSGQ